ncbi:hypothetical protein SAMN05443633_110153 [Chryseobacterium arachidis]|uniref:Uncharacterized protein n=1 Tax=Chryseobacterium arachidis TaxID=1416778 RepID=A0A1M5HBX0_9FLAO|nr:hypothetical protein [Chryseobacterium arachidis]SHG13456.1 hypothetical protein SAMN05443633_110153 [Chryseobacterium arachidis]
MAENKIIVRTESENLWWGIYGLNEKTGWEDLTLFDESHEKIGRLCLCTKSYLRAVLEDLVDDENEIEFRDIVQRHLSGEVCNYWFCYDEREDEDFFEVDFEAPKNEKGVKPSYIEIFHPDEGIGIDTIQSAVNTFAKDFLHIDHSTVEVVCDVPLEEAVKSFKVHQERFGDGDINVLFSDKVITELSVLWKMEKEQVLDKLKVSI